MTDELSAKRRAIVAEGRRRLGDDRIDDLAELLLEAVINIADEDRWNATMEGLKRDLGVEAASDLCICVAYENSGLKFL